MENDTQKLSRYYYSLSLAPAIFLLSYPAITYMRYYFYVAFVSLIIVGIVMVKSNQKRHYTILHNTLKLLLLVGVFSLVFIDTSLLIDKVIDNLN